jgi:SAM-dependent methyltransferase
MSLRILGGYRLLPTGVLAYCGGVAATVLRDDEDAFGRQLLDLLDGRAGDAVLERDDGESGTSMAAEAFFAGYGRWAAPERAVFDHVRGRVLDVGCGAGRHSLEAIRRGLEVVAIDISPGAVAVCTSRGVADARLLPLEAVDPALGTFDTVLMLCGNFGLPGTRESTVDWLRRLHDMTAVEARIVLDTVDPYPDSDPEWVAYMRRNRERGRMPGQVTIRLRYGPRVTPWFDLLLVSAHELAELADEAGWRVAVLDETEPPDVYAVLEKSG